MPSLPARAGRRLRVAHVVRSDAFAGVERYITNVAPDLARRGIDIVVIGGDPDRMRPALEPFGIRSLPAASTLETARRLVEAQPLDLVHTHMLAAEVAAVLSAPVTRAPFVTTRHFAAPRGSGMGGRMAGAVVARAVRREVAISSFVAGAIGRTSVVIPSAVPSRDVAVKRKPVVLMAQRLEQEKGVDVGIRAWAQSELARSGWRLVVAGGGSLENELRTLVERLGISRSVDLVGRQRNLDALLAEAGILLATTRAEGFGLSVVEAMACGTPVVACASGAYLETVGSCSQEWLFPPGDDAGCADRLRRLAHNSHQRTMYGLALQQTQRERFDLGLHVDRLLELYAHVVAVQPAPTSA